MALCGGHPPKMGRVEAAAARRRVLCCGCPRRCCCCLLPAAAACCCCCCWNEGRLVMRIACPRTCRHHHASSRTRCRSLHSSLLSPSWPSSHTHPVHILHYPVGFVRALMMIDDDDFINTEFHNQKSRLVHSSAIKAHPISSHQPLL